MFGQQQEHGQIRILLLCVLSSLLLDEFNPVEANNGWKMLWPTTFAIIDAC